MVTSIKPGNSGFSLVEILTATIVMTMMMVAVISYIQYGSEIWRRGHSKISSENYTRMAFELIKQDLLKASLISIPVASSAETINASLSLQLKVSPTVPATFSFAVDPTTKVLQKKIIASTSTTFNTRIARNVNFFQVARISTWTFRISIQINGDPDEQGNVEVISSQSIVLMAPGAGG